MGTPADPKSRGRSYRWAFSWLPITVRPKLLGLKNRYTTRRGVELADVCALVMTALLMAGLYYGTWNTLRELERSTLQESVRQSLLFGFSLGLFTLIILSAAVTGLSTLFMARDVDLLLSSPVADTSFLRGKSIEVLASTTWMILVFSTPPFLAFGQRFGAGAMFFLIAPVFIGLFLLLAVLAGMIVAIVCASLLPARTGRNILAALFIITLGVVLTLLNATPDTKLYTRFLNHHFLGSGPESSMLSLLHHPALPSAWLSNALTDLLTAQRAFPTLPFIGLMTTIAALWHLLVATYRSLYSRGYNRLHTQPQAYFLFRRSGTSRRRALAYQVGQTTRALATRELFSFGRDITHTVQLALFLTICILYFVNFQSISAPIHVGPWVLRAWDLIAIVSFLVVSSLIMLSICARFVFPSVSLEGASLWVLQVAPITPRAILRAKYITWAIPLGSICAVLFASAGLALALEPLCIIALGIAACIITHGLVALGIGLGARCSRFDWEHPAELATSWGSLLYLVTGLMTVLISFIPLCLMFGCYLFFPAMFQTTNNLLALFSVGLGVLLLIHLLIGKIALRIGVSALTKVFAEGV